MSDTIGSIKWRTIECETGARSIGESVVRLADVTVVKMPLDREQSRALGLSDGPESKPPGLIDRARKACGSLNDRLAGRSQDEPQPALFRKRVQLGDSLAITYAEFPSYSQQGFGFLAERSDEQLFCWEWFVSDGRGIATKLQETGTIAYTLAITPNGEEIAMMEFRSDVSCRLIRPSIPFEIDPVWRIEILEGSRIVWPSLVEGAVVANGFF